MLEHLRRIDSRTLARFVAGGLLSSVVTLGTTAFLHEVIGVREPIAAAGGLTVALAVGFIFSRFFIFRGTKMAIGRQLLLFLGSSGVFRGMEYLGFLGFLLLDVHYLLALVLVLGASFTLKFFVYDKLVFPRNAGVDSS